MENDVNAVNVAVELKSIYEKTSDEISLDAIVNRALTEKITSETINQKVNAQMNAISVGIKSINPRFNEKSKNYDLTKSAILDSLTNYEEALVKLSQFYDNKIEQLILRKVELEAHLLGSVIREEYLYKKEIEKINQKEKDKVKRKISNSFRGIAKKIINDKKENQVDVSLIHKATDNLDIENEILDILNKRIEKTKQEEVENIETIKKVEKEAKAIETEIKRINEMKKANILNAMEVGNKWVSTSLKKPRTFTKLTRFFYSRFNTPKMINKIILEPLNIRIEEFIKTELANING